MSRIPNYLHDQVCLNVLANSVENAVECYEAAEGHILLGVLSKNYETDEAAIADMKNIKQQRIMRYQLVWEQVIQTRVKW